MRPPPKVRPTFHPLAAPRTATGEGERTQFETRGGYSFHHERGWVLQDHPLGLSTNAPPTKDQLAASAFHPSPTFSLGGVGSSWKVNVYDRLTSVEYLVVVETGGRVQFIVCNTFPSLLKLLGYIKPLLGDPAR